MTTPASRSRPPRRAGSLFSLAEVLGGLVVASTWDATGYLPVVGDLRIHFRRPAAGVIRAAAELPSEQVDRVARELAQAQPRVRYTVEAVLTDEAGTPVASTSGEYLLIRTDPAS